MSSKFIQQAYQEVINAEQRIRSHIRETLLDHSQNLSKKCGANIFLKLENLQYTNSFKLRGALNKLLSLSDLQRKSGVVTASSGNHGVAVAYGLQQLNMKGIVFVPEYTSPVKKQAIENYGTELRVYGENCGITESHAREYAKQHHMIYISPYNDWQVVGGQGTIAIELIKQLKKIDVILVSLGGGGLISGIASFIKTVSPSTKIIGCSPENSPEMLRCVEAGKIIDVESKPTLSDATAGPVEQNSITFNLCRELVDEYILVSEQEIEQALKSFIETHHLLIEGAAAVALAALLKNRQLYIDKNVVVLICGARISLQTLQKILCQAK